MAQGKSLLDNLTTSTGLPEDMVSEELKGLLDKAGISPEDVTMDDLRDILAEYLQEVLTKAKEEFGSL